MSILQQLLEYEDSSLQGIQLRKNESAKYEPTEHHHQRYHKTQAGLYVVLRHHKDGSIQQTQIIGEGTSGRTYSWLDGQNKYLIDGFSSEDLVWKYNPSDKNSSICRSHTKHSSGVEVTSAVDGRNNNILSVELSGWTKIEGADLPAWRLRVQRIFPGTPYRSNHQPTVEGKLFSYGIHALQPDGTIKTAASPNIEGKRLDLESSISNILELMQQYNSSEDQKPIVKRLNSLDCLIFE